ncbi:MAG: hypothetical protein VXZ82_17545 [Planctomycetota bacterium]|nr:hypothetical protein [Planctomycetota bacterium]
MQNNAKHCTAALSLALLAAFGQTNSLAQDEADLNTSSVESVSVDWFQSKVSILVLSSFTILTYFSREYCSKLVLLGRRADAIEHWNLSFEITAEQGKHSYEYPMPPRNWQDPWAEAT